MTHMVQLGNPPANPLVPTTTLPDLLCHTITDKELDLLTDRSATILGGLCSAAFGVASASIVGALPAIEALLANAPAAADRQAYVSLLMLLLATPTFLISGILTLSHLRKRNGYAAEIRARPKMPMAMAGGSRRRN